MERLQYQSRVNVVLSVFRIPAMLVLVHKTHVTTYTAGVMIALEQLPLVGNVHTVHIISVMYALTVCNEYIHTYVEGHPMRWQKICCLRSANMNPILYPSRRLMTILTSEI